MDFRHKRPWLCWEILFSMLCMLCMDNKCYLNLDLMLFGNYVVIMIMPMYIYLYMYVCMSLSDRVVRNHACFMLMFIYVCMYVSVSLSDRVVRNRSCGGMIAYAGEWHEIGSRFHEESSGKSNLDRFMRSVSCGHEFILCVYNMPFFTLWTGNAEKYISGMKAVRSMACWDKHGWLKDTGSKVTW